MLPDLRCPENNNTILSTFQETAANFPIQETPPCISSIGWCSPDTSGLVPAVILSAALSSLSSGVNSACSVIEKDFLSRRPEYASSHTATVTRLKWLTWLMTVVAVALSMLNLLFVGNLIERCFKLINLSTAPLFVLSFLALFVRWTNAFGAWLGLLASIATAVSIAYAKDLGLPLTISFVWIIPGSLFVGITAGAVASGITGRIRPFDQRGRDTDL